MTKIDVISGFLGAGKTTFANMLLRYYMDSGLRPAYIVNEFGQTGLDAQIIESNGFKSVEIEGGCICCTLKYDIAAALREVIDTFAPTNIVFEPSGIFMFDNFLEILKQPGLSEKCKIGNVITIVDSVNFSLSKAVYGNFIYNQIKNAPVIILSKLEKTDKPAYELICDVKNINPYAVIISKVWSEWGKTDFDIFSEERRPVAYNSHHHGHFESFTATCPAEFSQDKINVIISRCINGNFGDIYRMKGVVKVDGELKLINIALNDVSISRFKGISEPSLTFIGNTINRENISAELT